MVDFPPDPELMKQAQTMELLVRAFLQTTRSAWLYKT
jgi:hypothetical protein